ncbi:MAG TPA: TfoX/Sxy family protein [Thermoplasmata archaeon]|nr:TfoX/Sxy family protein [Thermoplasmata archaeon]
MPFNESLAVRLRVLLPDAVERRMFGGVGWMERGHLIAGVSHDDLIVRVPPDETARWLRSPGAKPMMEGRAMKGWLKVSVRALDDPRALVRWVERSRAATRTLPPK